MFNLNPSRLTAWRVFLCLSLTYTRARLMRSFIRGELARYGTVRFLYVEGVRVLTVRCKDRGKELDIALDLCHTIDSLGNRLENDETD